MGTKERVVSGYVKEDGDHRIGSKDRARRYFAFVEVDGKIVWKSKEATPYEEASKEALSRATAVRRGESVHYPAEVGTVQRSERVVTEDRLEAIDDQHGGGFFPRAKKEKPKARRKPKPAKEDIPAYATGVERERFSVRRAERVFLEREGRQAALGFFDPVSETYRMKAHYYDGGYEIGEDEYEEIVRLGVRWVEADYRSKSTRYIYVMAAEVYEEYETIYTPNGPRRIAEYWKWTKELPDESEPKPKPKRRRARAGTRT